MTSGVDTDKARTLDGRAPLGRGDVVHAFARGLDVIKTFDADSGGLTLSEVARRAGMPRATARRLLNTLVVLGYVRVNGNRFSLRPRVLELGYAYLSAQTLPELAMPHLEWLAGQVGESSYLSVVDEYDNLCIAQVPVRRIWDLKITVGTALPAFTTASGRAIYAFHDAAVVDALLGALKPRKITPYTITDKRKLKQELRVVREQGWSRVDEELEEGLRTVAVPVRENGAVVAAISVSTLVRGGDSQPHRIMQFVPLMLEAAAAIEADLDASAVVRDGAMR